jgi:cell wall-associated NlpC family hydrolase
VLAPPGQPKIVEFSMPTADSGLLATPGAPNPELQRPEQRSLTVQWSNSTFNYFGAPPCHDAGALTNWDSGVLPPIGAAAPAGATRVVEITLNQVGKRYIWGAKGPETFDCSGLVAWAYAQIGIHIPTGTANQWPLMRPVAPASVQDGDLAFFDTLGAGHVTHVGMVFRRDGQWRLVHAASPQLGVREDALDSSYYRSRLLGFRTVR